VKVRKGGRTFSEEEKKYWAFQPVKRVAAPAVKDAGWARGEVDRFVLAKLEEKGLRPAPEADKASLLRRAFYDLTGLPPSPGEVRAFLRDESPDAYEKVVDRLLSSPRYGERWGRHWLDVARYADSTGNDEDHRYPYAWRYRDYVIEAFNANLPYDEFLREQIAGDLMPARDGSGVNRRGIVATGFLALGAKAIAQQDKLKMQYDVWDEQVDVVSKSVLGMTLACARCHDHKFDPLLTRDYYSWVGIFASTRNFADPEAHVSKLLYTPLVPAGEYAKWKEHQERVSRNKLAIEDVIDQEKERYNGELAPKLAAYMLAAREVYEKKREAKAVAEERGLEERLLRKWAEYLNPEGKIRPYLDAWDDAPEARWAEVAGEYQKRYAARLAEWNGEMAKWRERVRKMLAEMNMPPPERPKFEAAKDPFFDEVYMQRTGPFAVNAQDEERIFSAAAKAKLAGLREAGKKLEAEAPPEPDMACAVQEGEPVEQRILIRGDYGSLGEPVKKGYPAILGEGDKGPDFEVPAGQSGRMQLAEWLASKSNPLTARVMVNRIWQKHFGEGIVRTPDNFGVTGERPTHPELLDYLAAKFMDSGWDIKAMHREMMLSSAYRMSSVPGAEALEKDPENRLFSRFPRRRMDIEEIRDGLLAIGGTLDLTMGGTLQKGFGTDGENSADRLSINPETQKRRTVYLPLRRANLPALLNLFDFGDATTASGKRASTNVAPQALFLMNSQFLTERSAEVAGELMKLPEAERVEEAYLRVLNRMPRAGETDAARTYVAKFRERFPGGKADVKAWQSLSRVLMASNDFIYVD
jgi:hypothetical protein